MTAQAMLNQARQSGLQIRADAGQIKIAGTSELIQKWRPILAPHKAELLAILAANEVDPPADLDALIEKSARFWQWDDDDLALIREAASRDPDGIRLALTTNPLRHLYGHGTVADTPLGCSDQRR